MRSVVTACLALLLFGQSSCARLWTTDPNASDRTGWKGADSSDVWDEEEIETASEADADAKMSKTKVGALTGAALGAGLGLAIGSTSGNAGEGLALGTAAGAATGAGIGAGLQARASKSDESVIRRQQRIIAEQKRQILELRREMGDEGYEVPDYNEPGVEEPVSYEDTDSGVQRSGVDSPASQPVRESDLVLNDTPADPYAATSGREKMVSGYGAADQGSSIQAKLPAADVDTADFGTSGGLPGARTGANLDAPQPVKPGATGTVDTGSGIAGAVAAQSPVIATASEIAPAKAVKRTKKESSTTGNAAVSDSAGIASYNSRSVSPGARARLAGKVSASEENAVNADNTPPKKPAVRQVKSSAAVSRPEPKPQQKPETGAVPEKTPQVVKVEKQTEKKSKAAEPVKVAKKSMGQGCEDAALEAKRGYNASSDADKLFYFRRAIRLCPANPEYFVEVGKVYMNIGRTEDAQHEFSKALELDPENAEAQEQLSMIMMGASY